MICSTSKLQVMKKKKCTCKVDHHAYLRIRSKSRVRKKTFYPSNYQVPNVLNNSICRIIGQVHFEKLSYTKVDVHLFSLWYHRFRGIRVLSWTFDNCSSRADFGLASYTLPIVGDPFLMILRFSCQENSRRQKHNMRFHVDTYSTMQIIHVFLEVR